MTDRERFEAWAVSVDLPIGKPSYYAWQAWQAGQQHLEQKIAHGCTDAACKECDDIKPANQPATLLFWWQG